MAMRPLSGRCAPASTLMSVLLPAPFSPTRARTSPACSVRSTPRSASTPGNDLLIPSMCSSGVESLEGCIVAAVCLSVECGRDQDLRRQGLALETLHDSPRRFPADALGILDRIGVDLAVLDGLLALGLAVEADDLDAVGLAGLLQGGAGAQRGRVVDGEDAGQI